MFLLRVAIIFWVIGFFLAFTLRGVIQLLSALAVTVTQFIMQVFNGRDLT